jgi:hypothetical protein
MECLSKRTLHDKEKPARVAPVDHDILIAFG